MAAEPRGRKQSHTASKSNLLPIGNKFSRFLRVCGLESGNHDSKNREGLTRLAALPEDAAKTHTHAHTQFNNRIPTVFRPSCR